MVTGKASHARLEQILEMERIAANRELPKDVRKVADDELAAIRNGGPVDPGYQRVKAAQRLAELMKPATTPTSTSTSTRRSSSSRRTVAVASRRTAPAARPKPPTRKRSTRSFSLKWAELDGWSKKYDVEQIAREIKPDDWALFLRVIDETKAFAEAVTLAKEVGRHT